MVHHDSLDSTHLHVHSFDFHGVVGKYVRLRLGHDKRFLRIVTLVHDDVQKCVFQISSGLRMRHFRVPELHIVFDLWRVRQDSEEAGGLR